MESQSLEPPPSGRSFARSAAWAAIDNWIQQGVGLVTFIAVGNVLGPEIYGILALGFLYHLLAGSLVRDTFGDAVIQRPHLERLHIDTAFWTVVGLGTGMSVLSLLAAPLFATLFQEPRLTPVLMVLGATFPLLAAANLYRSLMRRDMNFRALAIRAGIACGGSSILAITLAHKGFGLWSLLAYQVSLQILEILALAVQSRYRPRLAFSRRHYHDLAGYSYKSWATQFLGNLSGQIDRLIIGYFVGASALGLFGMGRRILDGIDQTVLGVIGQVALPAFTRLQHDRAALSETMIETNHFASLIACPVYGGLALVAPRLVDLLFKPEWHPTGAVVSVLCLAGFLNPAATFLGSAQRALGQAGVVLMFSLAAIGVRLLACLAAIVLGYGFFGVLIAAAVSPLLLLPPRLYFVRRAIGLDVTRFLRSMVPGLTATALMVVGVRIVDLAMGHRLPGFAVLALMIAAGILSYGLALMVVAPASLKRMLRLLPKGAA